MLRELLLEGGGFASSQDADTDGKEGLTFTWTRSDGIPGHDAARVRGRAVHPPRRARRGDARGALRDARAAAEAGARRQGGRVLERAGARCARRVRAGARARRLGRRGPGARRVPARADVARTTGGCTAPGATASRRGPAYLEDYADVANGLLELHAATGELRWLEEANRLARLAIELFCDEQNGGFFQTPADGEELVVRKKVFDDSPAPSGNSMLAYVLLRLARIYGDDELEEKAGRRLQADLGGMQNSPLVVRLGARRGRPLPRAAARDRDRRAARRARSRRRRCAAGIRTP